MNKYNYIHVLQGDYGQGWEDLTTEDSRREIVRRRHEYRIDDDYVRALRIVKRRELNPDYFYKIVSSGKPFSM